MAGDVPLWDSSHKAPYARLTFTSTPATSHHVLLICRKVCLKPNTHRRRRRDETRQFRLVGVGGVYWTLDIDNRVTMLGRRANDRHNGMYHYRDKQGMQHQQQLQRRCDIGLYSVPKLTQSVFSHYFHDHLEC